MSGGVLNSKAVMVGVGVAVAALAVYFLAKKAGDAAKQAAAAVGTAVNPVSDQNLAYRGTNAVGAALTGDDGFSLGSWLYDFTHDRMPAPDAPVILNKPAIKAIGSQNIFDAWGFLGGVQLVN